MARRQRDQIDPTERHPFGRRRFLQGAAATTAAAFPILRASSAHAGGGCDLYDTPPSFMGVVPDPESVLGFPIGVDEEVSAADSNTYLQAVAAASDRVREALVGQSVDGRPIRYAVVGHPGNITVGGLEAIRQANLEIRDPETRRGRADELARTTPAFAWMTGNVHGSEESGADAALQLLYELADRDDCVVERILDELVIFVIPVQNPDGRVLDQRRNAYGFDLNRDFFARAQVETDDRVELMRTYPPVLLLDHHEFGYYRSFFPPNADPVHHEVPEQVMRQIDDLYGPAMARLFHRNDWPFFNGGIYDFLAPQFNDTGTSLGFNGVGMTLEVYNGSPMDRRFARQLGIQWACLWQLARNRRRVLRAWHDASVTAVEQGKAGKLEPNKRYFRPDLKVRTQVPTEPLRHYFVLDTPRTHDEVSILIRRLQRMDVDVYRLDEDTPLPDFHELGVPSTGNAAPAVGTVVPAGTVWIPMAQRQKHWIQAVMGEQPYCPTYYTYGLSGWSFPLSMNLEAGSTSGKVTPSATLLPLEPVPAPPPIPQGAPTIGLYRMSSGGYAAESFGATQWLFDTYWNVPYTLPRGRRHHRRRARRHRRARHARRRLADRAPAPRRRRRAGDPALGASGRAVRGVPGRRGEARAGARSDDRADARPGRRRARQRRAGRARPEQPSRRGHRPMVLGLVRRRRRGHRVAGGRPPSCSLVARATGSSSPVWPSASEQLYGTPAVIDEPAAERSRRVDAERSVLRRAHGGLAQDPVERDLRRRTRADVPRRPRGVRASGRKRRRAAFAEPSWPMAIRVSVASSDEDEVRRMLRRFRARFVVRHDGDVARFRIRNPRELTAEEHPWVNDLALGLQRSGIDVRAFSTP